MPKLTQKQERFCLSYIETGNASEAYRVNYNAEKMGEPSLNVAAHELLNNPKITLRLAELQKAHQERHKITIDSLTSRLTAAEQLGLSNNNPSAAVSAIMGIAKLHGLITDKQKVDVNGQLDIVARLQKGREYARRS